MEKLAQQAPQVIKETQEMQVLQDPQEPRVILAIME